MIYIIILNSAFVNTNPPYQKEIPVVREKPPPFPMTYLPNVYIALLSWPGFYDLLYCQSNAYQKKLSKTLSIQTIKKRNYIYIRKCNDKGGYKGGTGNRNKVVSHRVVGIWNRNGVVDLDRHLSSNNFKSCMVKMRRAYINDNMEWFDGFWEVVAVVVGWMGAESLGRSRLACLSWQ